MTRGRRWVRGNLTPATPAIQLLRPAVIPHWAVPIAASDVQPLPVNRTRHRGLTALELRVPLGLLLDVLQLRPAQSYPPSLRTMPLYANARLGVTR